MKIKLILLKQDFNYYPKTGIILIERYKKVKSFKLIIEKFLVS